MGADPYKYFRIEARELLDGLGRGILTLEKTPGDKGLVAHLLRHAHTLKGASRVVKHGAFGELAHAVEDVLAPFREAASPSVPRERIDELLRLVDAMGGELAAIDGAPAPRATRAEGARAPATPKDLLPVLRIDVREMDQLLEAVIEAGVHATGQRRHVAALEQAVHVSKLLVEQLAALRLDGGPPPPALPRARAVADDLRRALEGAHRSLAVSVDQTEVELAHVRDAADRLRLLPARAMFGALERAVRDAAQELGRPAELRTIGGEVRLDAHVLARVRDALLHAVRNAVAHGIEAPEQRERSGKPPIGTVTVEVQQRGRRVAFTCRDDGGGVDVEAVRRAAVRAGLCSADAAGRLRDADVAALLLRGAWLSSVTTVTHMSGRGVGLDVLRHTAARLRGEAAIRTERGRGTEIEISVPISLSSSTVLQLRAGDAVASLPLSAVRKTLQLPAREVARSGHGSAIAFEGELVPFAPLASLLGAPPRRDERQRWQTVLLRSGARLAAIGVDGMSGTADVVVHPVPDRAEPVPLVAGATFDAEGNPQLVLDPAAVVAAVVAAVGVPEEEPSPRLPILVVDDSLTTRMLEQSILESAGYRVELATSAEEALVKARERRFGLFVVDVEMPGMDGFELVRTTRADPVLGQVPAILVTSRSAPEDRRRGAEVGARAYIAKSEFDQGQLLDLVRQLVG